MLAERPKRWPLAALAAIGLALVGAPFAFGMFSRAPRGAHMITSFAPYMTNRRLDGFQSDLRYIDGGVLGGQAAVRALDAAGGAKATARFPEFVTFERQWSAIDPDMTAMLDTIQANIGNFRAVAALPSFRLFPLFFVIPGAIVLLLVGLAWFRPGRWPAIRWVLAVVGVGLVLAPVAFQMFSRAPKGARMVSAFTTIETRARVERIQIYFSDIASGQGTVELELIPALKRAGLDTRQIDSRYPGLTTLDAQWVHVLNDMTPMIGAMSDNVTNYQAVAALPSFRLFPWFFVLPGLVIIALVAFAGPRRRSDDASVPHHPEFSRPSTKESHENSTCGSSRHHHCGACITGSHRGQFGQCRHPQRCVQDRLGILFPYG